MHDQATKQLHYEETFLGAMRILIADVKNAHWKFNGGPVKPEDIFKLSYDTVATEADRKISEADWNKRIPKKKK